MKQYDAILAVRKFNRFYTKYFGLLRKSLLDSDYSLSEARVLYDLAQTDSLTSKEIVKELELDPGYLSRIIKRFESMGLVSKERSKEDGRAYHVSLTKEGKQQAKLMADRANNDLAEKLDKLSPNNLATLTASLNHIEQTFQSSGNQIPAPIIRSHRAGDIGWIISEHGKYYSEHHSFNEGFEALVAQIAADFINDYDPELEHCWIAELNGKNVGSIMLVWENETTARLRLLYVSPDAQGYGLGKKLVSECIAFARNAGYSQIELWTNKVLETAHHVYEKSGFELIGEDTHEDFGEPQVGQTWRLTL